mmetsp:Transcript_24388/g.62336  ORF Transcript_24388/g.62336 Transcript_24388/m.62336 type:complete len:86 (-) Transcript_24388:177-434(-)
MLKVTLKLMAHQEVQITDISSIGGEKHMRELVGNKWPDLDHAAVKGDARLHLYLEDGETETLPKDMEDGKTYLFVVKDYVETQLQ